MTMMAPMTMAVLMTMVPMTMALMMMVPMTMMVSPAVEWRRRQLLLQLKACPLLEQLMECPVPVLDQLDPPLMQR
jgi:hypothetical protein